MSIVLCLITTPLPCDSALGLQYYNYRHLNTLDGRWMNRDPIEEWGGLNLTLFADNDALNNIDKDGLFVVDVEKEATLPEELKPSCVSNHEIMTAPETLTDKVALKPGETLYGYLRTKKTIGWNVECSCACDDTLPKSDSNWTIKCKIRWKAEMFLNREKIHELELEWIKEQKKKKDDSILNPALGAYGHEQQHLVAIINKIKAVVIIPLEARQKSKPDLKGQDCHTEAMNVGSEFMKLLSSIKDEDRKHGKDGHPQAGEFIKPLPNSVWPSKPKK